MFVLGTAGHVDHGKSSFLNYLTGMEADRLPEEKKRGMTIDLGFVWYARPRGEKVGIVDVPGHKRFVRNMISGVAHVDAFLFVVAADDGWMPQSEEHLNVLAGMGVREGMAILTKTDLVDKFRVAEVKADVESRLAERLGKSFEVMPWSKEDPPPLKDFKEKLERVLQNLPPVRDVGSARLWIDRVFVPRGEGVVVTGTLREGKLREGDRVVLSPQGYEANIRSIHAYGERVSEVGPVCRVALGIQCAEGKPERGMSLAKTTAIAATRAFDGKMDWFGKRLLRNRELSLHVGTTHASAQVIPLGPDGSFIRVRLPHALPVLIGERFALRTSGGEETLGLGVVADVECSGSHQRAREALDGWAASAPGQLRYQAIRYRFVDLNKLSAVSQYSVRELKAVMDSHWVGIGAERYFTREAAQFLWSLVPQKPIAEKNLLSLFSKALRSGTDDVKLILDFWISQGELRREASLISLKGLSDPLESRREKEVMGKIAAGKGTPIPPALEEATLKSTLKRLVRENQVVSLGEEHYMTRKDLDIAAAKITRALKEKEKATTGELREILGLNRKHAVMILEKLDSERLTYLKEGVRRLLGN